jgi:hypothetical protein
MKDTVLIVASHTNARSLVNWEREDCDYWTFNEAYSRQFAPDAKESDKWCKRSDVVFQMHDPIIWKNPQNRNDKTHADWLKSGNTPAIIMQEAYEEVPKAVKYPLDEVIKKFGEVSRKFFTSSVALGLALAAHYGYKRIEMYGIEMEFGSEYFEQRDAVTFWMGIAAGCGIEVIEHCKFLSFRPLYGYDGKVTVDKREFEERITELTPLCEQAKKDFEALRPVLHAALTDLVMKGQDKNKEVIRVVQNMSIAASRFGQLDGARQNNERYKEKSDKTIEALGTEYIFVKTEFEQAVASHELAREDAIASAVALSGKMEVLYNNILTSGSVKKRGTRANLLTDAINEFIVKSQNVGFFTGGAEENKRHVSRLATLIRAAGGEKSEAVMLEALQNA